MPAGGRAGCVLLVQAGRVRSQRLPNARAGARCRPSHKPRACGFVRIACVSFAVAVDEMPCEMTRHSTILEVQLYVYVCVMSVCFCLFAGGALDVYLDVRRDSSETERECALSYTSKLSSNRIFSVLHVYSSVQLNGVRIKLYCTDSCCTPTLVQPPPPHTCSVLGPRLLAARKRSSGRAACRALRRVGTFYGLCFVGADCLQL